MRFPRKAKIIRGQLDSAAMMSVLFLSLLFLAAQSALVFTPGIHVLLGPQAGARATLRLAGPSTVNFNNTEWNLKEWEAHLRKLAQKKTAPKTIEYDLPPNATNEIAALRAVASELGIAMVAGRDRILTPAGTAPSGAPAGGIVLMVNASGQAFLEGQWVSDEVLARKLAALAAGSRAPLNLVLQADRVVEYDRVVQIGNIARSAGIAGLVLATRPQTNP